MTRSPTAARRGLACCTVAVSMLAAAALPAANAPSASAQGTTVPSEQGYAVGGSVVARQSAGEPKLGFSAWEHVLPPRVELMTRTPALNPDHSPTPDDRTFFSRVTMRARDGDPGDLVYRVEGEPDHGEYMLCKTSTDCLPVRFGMKNNGYLHGWQDIDQQSFRLRHGLRDYPVSRIELSAEDPESGLKVYRDVLVRPTPRVAGCDDFPDMDADRFTCFFRQELLPAGVPAASSEMIGGLPDLVQPAENYELVFAEEFDYDEDDVMARYGACPDPTTALDTDVWTFIEYPCDQIPADSNDVRCSAIEDGYWYVAIASGCKAFLSTHYDIAYRYGYMEVKYTVNLHKVSQLAVLPLVIGSWFRESRFAHNRYGITIDDYENLLKYQEIEIDFFEFSARYRSISMHQYVNYNPFVDPARLRPRASDKHIRLCPQSTPATVVSITGLGCQSDDEVTMVMGLEWTPSGYRTFYRVEGVHDDLTLLPKDKITVQWFSPSNTRNTYTGAERDRFFEFLDEDDPGSVLEQVGVSHFPLAFYMNSWGYMDSSTSIHVKLKVDYIRVFQPRDHYAQMDPVYQ